MRTLIISPYSATAMIPKLDELDSPGIVSQVLALMDARFRAISSLQEIIVNVYENNPNADDTRMKVESHGWTVDVIEQEEEWDSGRSFGDFEDNNCLDDDYGDDYDIDNDSGF